MALTLIQLIEVYFHREIPSCKSYAEAFEVAIEKIEQEKGFIVPYSYDAYRLRIRRQKLSKGQQSNF